ncbi:Cob(I)yrinic acid a,c-diamide adenosyltransferase [Planctomycetes bacterium Pla163]|uniref:Corrinoid adenosyltransferase n=1 Tax=Rohdeia mirabilis TaxID=2528008 RepID=A0A518CWI8_9BACT|nr:Cob(I)yrinic acid a,c-diamide adenosyltransferase [Planctomycetes bacterium Pla163]
MGVRLNRIYTRSGDDGETGLGDGRRVKKHSLRVAAYGTIDEASSALGLARAHDEENRFGDLVIELQNDLFDLGSDLCVPGEMGEKLRVPADYVTRLERHIDRINADLEPLESFVLPGGDKLAAWLHLGRTVARRAERLVTELSADPDEADPVNPNVITYLNRLSDLLFVMARAANDGGRADVLWVPGGNAQKDASTDSDTEA